MTGITKEEVQEIIERNTPLKLRITPILKTLGFRYNKETRLYDRDMIYGARVYKCSDTERMLEIWKDTYNGSGEFTGSTLILKDFSLDSSAKKYSFYKMAFTDLAKEFESPELITNMDYYVGLTSSKTGSDVL